MTVYVDDVRHRFGRMIMCHMWADTEDELFHMAALIGLSPHWIQGHPTLSSGKARSASWVHFDVSLEMKARAIRHGAQLTDKYGPVEHTSKLKLAKAERTGNTTMGEAAKEMLQSIADLRKRRA